MNRRDVIMLLAANGLLYRTKDRDDVATMHAVAELAEDMGQYEPLDTQPDPVKMMSVSMWSIIGQVTGHEWFACDVCGEVRLMKVKKNVKCKMTPRCEGHMMRLAPRPIIRRGKRGPRAIPSGDDQGGADLRAPWVEGHSDSGGREAPGDDQLDGVRHP